MLRTKEIEVAGHKVKIANLGLAARRRLADTVKAYQNGKLDVTDMDNAACDAVLASLQRADPSFTLERMEQLFDGDDILVLYPQVMKWTAQIPGLEVANAGEPRSP